MQNYLERGLTSKIILKIQSVPAVAILGPRQCGKSTLARNIISRIPESLYLDLERPSDLNKFRDPEAYFSANFDKLICLDEIQRVPDLFPVLRSVIDERNRNGQFIILGSASPDLIKQSSESLAGRIAFFELTPFLLNEVSQKASPAILRKMWLRGGYPRSYLATKEKDSYEWRLNFIRTYLERDIPQLGFRIPARTLERFWKMCAHLQGQLLNNSKIGDSLGVSNHSIRSYVDILDHTFILRVLPPYAINLKKRLVKSPKIFLRDTGLLHAILDIETQNDLLGHPVLGSSWEGLVIENILSIFSDWKAFFYRTATGSEIDLILERGRNRIAVECKASSAPTLNKGFWQALTDLQIQEAWVIAPVKESYPVEKNVTVAPLGDFVKHTKEK
jgi:uncharacterized protein